MKFFEEPIVDVVKYDIQDIVTTSQDEELAFEPPCL